jgi:hypothetical protein
MRARGNGRATDAILNLVLRRFYRDQRRFERMLVPPVVAYLGNAGASEPLEVADISIGGFCLLTHDHWTPGTEMPITLRREDVDPNLNLSPSLISVQAVVVRRQRNEVGFSIVLSPEQSTAFLQHHSARRWVSDKEMRTFLEQLKMPIAQPSPVERRDVDSEMTMEERARRLVEQAQCYRLSRASELFARDSAEL